jgi:hypothetical protein
LDNVKSALVVVQGKTQRRGIARYSKELQRRHVPLQACNSRCSVIHPTGEIRNLLRMEQSTDFFRFNVLKYPNTLHSTYLFTISD